MGALYCIFFAYVGVSGLGFFQFCRLNSFQNKFILAFSIFLGLLVPQDFNGYMDIKGYGPTHTSGRWYRLQRAYDLLRYVIGAFHRYMLDNTLYKKNAQIGKDKRQTLVGQVLRSRPTPGVRNSIRFLSISTNIFHPFKSSYLEERAGGDLRQFFFVR
ncbi:hypothetical protein OROMI_001014 [Orobanche minor]